MWVIRTHDIAHHAGRFREVAIRPIATVVHGVKDTTMHGLKAVANIG